VGAAISPMRKGQAVPFTGVLLSPKATATIITQLKLFPDLLAIEVNKTRGEELARCNFRVSEVETRLEADKKILGAQLEERNKHISILVEQGKQDEKNRVNTPVWVGLGATAGFVIGAGLTVLTAYALNQSSK